MSDPLLPGGSATRGAARSFRNRVRYRFDRLLSRGMWAVLLWLGAITFLVVLLSALLLTISSVSFTGEGDSSFPEEFWQSLLRVIDPGTMAGDVGIGRRILALTVTMTGVLIAGTLIGLIAAGVEQRVEQLRRGRSIVVESGHYVVLGWSDRVRVVIDQLTKADPRAVVVVLADRDAPDMDDDLRPDLDPSLGQRLIFRSGDPRLRSSVALTNVEEARAVIVLAPEAGGEADVVTTVLTLGRAIGFDGAPIVVEVSSDRVTEKLLRVTGPSLHPVNVAESSSRSAALVLRQAGLSEVVEELIEPTTAGVHVAEVLTLVGSTFADAVFGFDSARPIGVIGPDGALRLNPPPATTISAGDQLVAIAGAASDLVPAPTRAVPSRGEPIDLGIVPKPMRLLFVGWNRLAPALLAEFDRFAADGSTVLVLVDDTVLALDDVHAPTTTHFDITIRKGSDPTDPLRDAKLSSIILLAYPDDVGADAADGRTLLDLALVKRELSAASSLDTQLLVQLLDADRATLADMVGLNGFIISDAVSSGLMAQFATSPQRQTVFRALYDPERASLHLLSSAVLGVDAPTAFVDVIAAAHEVGVLAIGLLTPRERGRRAVLSPELTTTVDQSDQVIVIG